MTETAAEPRIRRKLAAILAADVAGYARLTAADEEGTARMLLDRRAVIDALIDRYGGRIANTAGDSVIAEFASSVEAVRAALDIQESVRTQNLGVPDDRQVLFRIGINVGDVIEQGGDLLGDGVNVAARLEALAAPGGICLSGEVHDQIQGKLSLDFQSIGARQLKNIDRRVRAYRIAASPDLADAAQRPRRPLLWGAMALVLLCALGVLAVVLTRPAPVAVGVAEVDPAALPPDGHPAGEGEVVASGIYEGRLYEAVLTWGGSWGEADADAKRRGGHLVSITSQAENDFVYGLIAGEPRLWQMFEDGQAFGPWIGLYQTPGAPEPDGGWAWVGGDPVTFKNFSEGQPNNFGGNSDVVRFHNAVHEPSPFWDDARTDSSSTRGYVMERPAE